MLSSGSAVTNPPDFPAPIYVALATPARANLPTQPKINALDFVQRRVAFDSIRPHGNHGDISAHVSLFWADAVNARRIARASAAIESQGDSKHGTQFGNYHVLAAQIERKPAFACSAFCGAQQFAPVSFLLV
jgi:hypothetical protein